MGKNKSQRTKNNAKPSNSSRSAELLGTSIPNFVGFSAVKDGGYVPVLPGLSISAINEVEINTIDPKFQMVFKKMNKKDPTTKFKALQEFADLCRNSALPSVEAVLPFWPRLYCARAVDIDHRVREASQLAHSALVLRVGRSIALYLKQLAGPWFTSQFDTYPPAASAAASSFQSTFPKTKLIDAIVHCQEEILTYIRDNLTHQCPQSLATQKILTPEETETKYQRILICSLQGYSHYLKQVPSHQIMKPINLHNQIISSPKFWKLGKHETLLIKTAFFNVLSSLIFHAPALLKDEKKRTITIIMNSLDESEPGILSAVWECFLVAIDNTEDWHTAVSIEKLVLPKLWKVLRNGGQGCASVVYPCLLPFLSQFPKFNVDNKSQLFVNFFENMRLAFTVKTVLMSRSEMLAITKSFVECLKYTIMLNNEDRVLCRTLLSDHLVPVVEVCIRDFSSIKGIVFPEVTGLVKYWSKNRNSKYGYSELIRIFWTEIETMFQRVTATVDSHDKSMIDNIHNAEIKFLMSLKKPQNSIRKHHQVRFADSEDAIEKKLDVHQADAAEDDEVFLGELELFVNNLSTSYIRCNNDIAYLNQLISIFESKELFTSLAKVQREDGSLLDFYNEVLKPRVKEISEDTGVIVNLIFTLLKYMTNEEKNIVLNSLTELDDRSLLNYTITCGLQQENRKDELIRRWLDAPRITEHLVNVSKEIVKKLPAEIDEKLLLLAFESTSEELSVNETAINEISEVLCQVPRKLNDKVFKNAVELMAKLLELSWSHKKWTSGSLKLLKTLFELSLNEELSTEIKEDIQQKWKIGFLRVQHKLNGLNGVPMLFDVQRDCFEMIYQRLHGSDGISIEELVDVSMDFIESSSNFEYHEALNALIKFNFEQEIISDEWVPHATDLVVQGEIISGNFYLENSLRSIKLDGEVTLVLPESEKIPDTTESCLKWALFNAKLINKLLLKLDADEIDESAFDDCMQKLLTILNSTILITSLGKLYQNHYKYSRNYEKIFQIHGQVEVECKKLRDEVPRNVWARILKPADIDIFWVEFGSLFNEFIKYLNQDEEHFISGKVREAEFLVNYLDSLQEETDRVEVGKTFSHHLNALIISRSLLQSREHRSKSIKILKHFISLHKKRVYLLNDGENPSSITTISTSDLYLRLEFIRLFTHIIKTFPEELDTSLWDCAMVYLSSWLGSLSKSKEYHEDVTVRSFAVAVSDFFFEFQTVITRHKCERITGVPENLLDEWRDIFAENVYESIVEIWMFYGKLLNSKNHFLTPIIVINHLGTALKILDGDILFGESSSINENQLMLLCIKLLSSPVASIQISSFHLLKVLVPKMVERDKLLIDEENFDCKRLNLAKFVENLTENQRIVNAMLMDFKLCDTISCVIQTHTDSYTYTLAYLLEWLILLEMCETAHADLRYQYAEVLKDELFPSLLNNVFRLIPVEVLQENRNKRVVDQIRDMFRSEVKVEIGGSLSDVRIEEIVCWIYIKCLRHLPVLARQWWSTTESRVSSAVDRITTLYVSPILCREELFHKRLDDVDNMQIKVQPVPRAVVAVYEMDDTKLELSMVLPGNHPLGLVTVEPGQHAGGASNWRNCHMQLSIFLTHQNGSIWDGLMMWKRNMDKKFAGVEECYICFSIFHVNTYQIPKLSCHTCRKKFHAPCLYKWFSTSQKATCPICRNVF
ncbi:E3 ubiquitin-protein ligase listerin [Fopius arisanus]|uniref:E3 ubiquitin-protein ligase listerin n=1 Tax=Fopius arisanus TaxID=64838 RepID=A0A9R1T2Z6_9HYME|nr:PREDICTED: E3 ubiquitin-protein ligase listerin [Fopius arisanus]